MGYSPSPRPVFDGPTAIPYAQATRHLWGDPQAGEVADWIYVSSDKIHQLLFGLNPGAAFTHSPEFRTVFGADELLYVLNGVMMLANPETGEVHRVNPGEAAFFRRDTWHHAFNHSQEPLRVLELFAPPPSQGTSGAYARTRPYLEHSRYTRPELMTRWPEARAEARAAETIRVLRPSDVLWRMEPGQPLVPVGIWAATEHLTVGEIELLPGQHTGLHHHGGDESLLVLTGTLNVRTPDHTGSKWHELQPMDGFYTPAGASHQYYNISAAPARFLFAVAPRYAA